MALFNATLFPPPVDEVASVDPPPSLRSKQEQLIENYINKSFGSFFLYAPLNYKYSENDRIRDGEPCDLFWHCEGMVVMFSLTKSKKYSLNKQIKHNVDQLEEYLTRWKTGNPDFDLCGKNRFGKLCRIKHTEVESLVLVSLVGKRCGIKNIKSDKPAREIWLNAPDKILEMLASANASLVDFLSIALTPHRISELENFEGMRNIVENYVLEGLKVKERDKFSILEGFENDIKALQYYLQASKAIESGEKMIFLFDLTLRQRTDLLLNILYTIHKSNPPDFTVTGIVGVKSYYYFIISTINALSAKTTLDQSFSRLKIVEQNGGECVQLTYGKMAEGDDFRSPMMVATSKRSGKILQAKFIYDYYLSWKTQKIPLRTNFGIDSYKKLF